MAKENKSQLCNLAEQEYWKRVLHSCVRAYGAKSMACANALFHLGNAHVKAKVRIYSYVYDVFMVIVCLDCHLVLASIVIIIHDQCSSLPFHYNLERTI